MLLPKGVLNFCVEVKNWGDFQFRVMMQCLREFKVRKALGDWRSKGTDQYINNVELKIKTQTHIHSYTKFLHLKRC
jgi:hypothetical protein